MTAPPPVARAGWRLQELDAAGHLFCAHTLVEHEEAPNGSSDRLPLAEKGAPGVWRPQRREREEVVVLRVDDPAVPEGRCEELFVDRPIIPASGVVRTSAPWCRRPSTTARGTCSSV